MTDTPGGHISDTPRECLGQLDEREEGGKEQKRQKIPIVEPVCDSRTRILQNGNCYSTGAPASVGGRRQEPLKRDLRNGTFFPSFAHGSPKAAVACGDCYFLAGSGKTFEIQVILNAAGEPDTLYSTSMTAFLAWQPRRTLITDPMRWCYNNGKAVVTNSCLIMNGGGI